MEPRAGIEPAVKALQTYAFPLGYRGTPTLARMHHWRDSTTVGRKCYFSNHLSHGELPILRFRSQVIPIVPICTRRGEQVS